MGCCLNKRPHTQLKSTVELLMLVTTEVNELTDLLEHDQNKIRAWKKEIIRYANSGLIEMKEKMFDSNLKGDSEDWKIILDLLDSYYDLKENVIMINEDDLIMNNKILRKKIDMLYKEEFLRKLNFFLGYVNNEDSSNSNILSVDS